MIGRLRGTLAEQNDTQVLVECGGVGYLVSVSTHTLLSLPPVGDPVTLRVFTHMMDSKITLYGFGSPFERDLFDLLITVKKVGPSSAVGILSGGADPESVARLIADEEIGMLTKLRGVGKKTAEMLVVELREKCLELLSRRAGSGTSARPTPAVVSPRSPGRPAVLDQVGAALIQLGWRPAEADKVVAELEAEIDPQSDPSLESLIRQALRSMPR
ncbi:MAG: Holliday junction branch migration protein RuvA [Proteobacteria bacterium]|nr:Holliday junction branch migration protein RuvA [Pseudomonadota bacterium]